MERDADIVIEEDGVTLIIPDELLRGLVDMNNLQDVSVSINATLGSEADIAAGNFLTVNVSITIGGEIIQVTPVPYAVAVSLADFGINLEGINTYRLVAISPDGTILGGRFDRATGLFIFESQICGDFTITYVQTLRRLSLGLDSFNITDLADNTPVQVMDVMPVIQDGRTLVPVRFVAYALGAEVDWTSQTEDRPLTVYITMNGETLSFGIGEMTPELAALGMDVPAQLMNGRTMVPLRFVSEFFGAIVTWDAETRTVEIIPN